MKNIEIKLPQDAQQMQKQTGRQMNKITIDVPDYSLSGIWPILEEKYTLFLEVDTTNTIIIKTDKGGLISLARHLLTLAQDEYPIGSHIHYDENNSLDDGSLPLIIDKIE